MTQDSPARDELEDLNVLIPKCAHSLSPSPELISVLHAELNQNGQKKLKKKKNGQKKPTTFCS